MTDDLSIAPHRLVRPRFLVKLANDESVNDLAQRFELLSGSLTSLARARTKEADQAAVRKPTNPDNIESLRVEVRAGPLIGRAVAIW